MVTVPLVRVEPIAPCSTASSVSGNSGRSPRAGGKAHGAISPELNFLLICRVIRSMKAAVGSTVLQ